MEELKKEIEELKARIAKLEASVFPAPKTYEEHPDGRAGEGLGK